jgi:hypothetical protein
LEELNSVAEGIVGEEPLTPVDRQVISRFISSALELRAQRCQVFDSHCNVRFLRWAEVRINSEVKLTVA